MFHLSFSAKMISVIFTLLRFRLVLTLHPNFFKWLRQQGNMAVEILLP